MRGPKRSISQPWNGLKKVCSTTRMENVTWMAAAEALSALPSGLVNSVQTYCGLLIAIMQTKPSRS